MQITTLPNGLRVVTETMPRVETASFGVWVDAGARYEAPEVNGVAHMLEHMAFKGTARRTAKGIAEEIEDVGGSLNAYTGREHTAYYARILADDVPLAADILTDILRHSTFDPEEFEKERHVILQEIGETLDTPSDLVFDQFQEAAFPDQPIGRSILGSEAIIETLPRDALQSFIDGHYGPEALIVAASGKVEHDAIVALAGEKLGDLAKSPKPIPQPASYTGSEWLSGRDLEQVHICLGLEAFAYTDPDFIPLQVFSTALGGGMSSRLFQEVRENRGLCYSVFTFSGLHKDSGVFGIYAGTGEKDVPELIRVIAGELRDLASSIGEAELRRAKAQLKASLLMGQEGCFSVCEDIARQFLCFGDYLTPAELTARYEAVDEAAIARIATRLLADPRPTVAAIGPASGLPDAGLWLDRLTQ
ncbi:MAG: pitrilysin family protein [Geminicoccaceae bacterium]